MPPLSAYEKRIDKALAKIQSAQERKILKNYKIALDQIRIKMSRIYETYAKKGKISYAQMTQYNRLNNLQNDIAKILSPVFKETNKNLKILTAQQYEESFFRHAWGVNQATRIDLKWGTLNPRQVAAAVGNNEQYQLVPIGDRQMAAFHKELRYTALRKLKTNGLEIIGRTINQGFITGQSYTQMARGLRDAITKRFAYEYIRIARTEGQRAAVLGQQKTYNIAKNKGVQLTEVWDATLDGRTRPDHGALDGKKKSDPEKGWWAYITCGRRPFHAWVRGPLRSGVACFDINCRCRVRGEIEGYSPQLRRIRDEGVQPYQNYEQWEKSR